MCKFRMKGDWFEVDPDEGTLHIPGRDEGKDKELFTTLIQLVGKRKLTWGFHYQWS